ncbi:MAG: hypothetical protein KKF44_06095 [Nanoarchaeota archaeon]|nr:hypothetical protein [Nanoarchaeota archaeon]
MKEFKKDFKKESTRNENVPRMDRRDQKKFGRRDAIRPHLEFTDIICDKCGKKSQVPFKPTTNKPIFCSDCFKKDEDVGFKPTRGSTPNTLEEINMKLDRILSILGDKKDTGFSRDRPHRDRSSFSRDGDRPSSPRGRPRTSDRSRSGDRGKPEGRVLRPFRKR